jgi:hypothetical protein
MSGFLWQASCLLVLDGQDARLTGGLEDRTLRNIQKGHSLRVPRSSSNGGDLTL